MTNTTKKTYGGQSYRVLTSTAKAEIAAAETVTAKAVTAEAVTAEPVQRTVADKPAPSTKTKGQIGKMTPIAPVEEITDASEKFSTDS